MTSHVHAHAARHAGAPEVRWAWWCVVGWFPTAVLAFVAGEGLGTLLGQSGGEVAPWWVAAVVLVATTAVLAVPTALAVRFDRRARRSGDERGRVPALLLLVLTGGFVLLNVASWVMMTVLG